jgi:hypothetical protein
MLVGFVARQQCSELGTGRVTRTIIQAGNSLL